MIAFVKYRANLVTWLRVLVTELVIAGYLPGRIGRHLIIDTLLTWNDGGPK